MGKPQKKILKKLFFGGGWASLRGPDLFSNICFQMQMNVMKSISRHSLKVYFKIIWGIGEGDPEPNTDTDPTGSRGHYSKIL